VPSPAGRHFSGRRIVICDYNALLISVTGLLRMSGYCVFQAYDDRAARELCHELPNIELLILNTIGTGTDTPTLVREIRGRHPDLPVLHIGTSALPGMPADVPTLAESFTADQLLGAVADLMPDRHCLPRENSDHDSVASQGFGLRVEQARPIN
jgi:DNA-binding NtrC family response regulator